MSTHPLDDEKIVSRLFYPRRAERGDSRLPNTQDGTILVSAHVSLGYRLYAAPQSKQIILYFHGNGETAADYDPIAPLYFEVNASLLVVDYRGYGWSTGLPRTTTLLTDAEATIAALPDILQQAKLNNQPCFIMGRSLGSAPAVHLAYKYSDQFKGLIVESGFADMPSVFRRLGIPVDLSQITDLPVGNARRMQEITLPLLVIHGENDQLLPVENGQKIYDAAPGPNKQIVRIPNAGHNDLLFNGRSTYFNALRQFLDKHSG